MKFSTSTLVLLAATLAVAIEHKRYIVTYDEGTDDAVVEKAIVDAKAAGIQVTYQFKLIKGFSADASTEDACDYISNLKFDQHMPHVEEDSIVTTQDSPK